MSPSTLPPTDDVDLTLRHLSHRLPEDFARALLPEAKTLRQCVWLESQFTARQRRIDRGLFVVADGVPRIEHVEWQLRWERDVPLRLFEYHCLQTLALWESRKKAERVPRVRTTLVVLSGREEPLPAMGRFRTSPKGDAFSGLRFRIEAPYQETVEALAARQSALWLAFAPLAKDATPEAMAAVVARLQETTTPRLFEEVAVTMTVLAASDGRRRGLTKAITAQLPKELIMQNEFLKELRDEGRAAGRQEGIKEGQLKGQETSLRFAIETTLSTRGLRLTATRRAKLADEHRIDVLETWFRRALTATRIAEVFAD